ncbi:MAG: hypothetical protein GY757_37100, partial [bacterium]|nr:hypothetical protein [bacterium]
ILNSRKKQVFALPSCRRVLVMAPHPDDEIAGCGGLLLRLLEQKAGVRVIFFTDGAGRRREPQREPERLKEMREVLRYTSIPEYRCLGLNDGEVRPEPTVEAALRSEIAAYDPDLLLSPSPLDAHPDHRAVCRILARSLDGTDSHKRVFIYEVWVPLPAPNHSIDITRQMEQKRKALALYAQQEKKYGLIEKCEHLNRFRGSLTFRNRITHAECYLAQDSGQYGKLIDYLGANQWFS